MRIWRDFDGLSRVNASADAADCESDLQQRVVGAIAAETPLRIVGSGSKSFYGNPAGGEPLPVSAHRGIVRYEPTELIVTARSGTALEELELVLTAEGQMLGFEPPRHGIGATLGGTVACGFSGPRRPFAGAARDFVLGCKLINGRGQIAAFGGEVMKNVAGFDVSRLMVGAMGTLGVLLEISLKVLPKPRCELTLAFDYSAGEAHTAMLRWARMPIPISAMAYDGRLRIRVSGAEEALRAVRKSLGGEAEDGGNGFWRDLNEHRLPFFASAGDLWRLSVPPAAPRPEIEGSWLIDWGGAQRWLKTDADPACVFAAAAKLGGHAVLFRSERRETHFQPMPDPLRALHRRVKQAFDPHGIFNVGCLDPGW